MTEVPVTFAHYLAAWNERDPERIRDHLDVAVNKAVLFVDPANTREGIDQLESLIREARQAMPNAEYRLASGIDGHNRRFRYRWEVRREDEPPIMGMDVATVDDSLRIVRIDGFFGDFPPLP